MRVAARAWFLSTLLALAVAAPAHSQEYQIDPAIAAKLAALGNRINVGEAAKIYAPLHVGAPKDGVKHSDNLAYGRDPLQKLDVYEPTVHPANPMPVFIYIHGGGFTRGDKTNHGNGPFYANLGYWFGRHGVVTVLANYRLAPKDPWPAGAKDMAGIVAWTHAHIADYGGDPRHVILMGESAGASHVAAYALEKRFQPLSGPGLAGAILFSGLYDPALETKAGPRFGMNGPGAPNENYYGKDRSHYAMHATLKHLTGTKLPVLIVYNEFDPPIMQVEAGILFGALCDHFGDCPDLLFVPHHVHGSAMFTINTADEWMATKLLDFIRDPAR
jgi:acetyl esterase